MRLKGFWGSDASDKDRRMFFQQQVFQAALSAAECFVWTQPELKRLNGALVQQARRSMKGRAHTQTTLTDNTGEQTITVHRTMTNQQVLRWWKLPDISTELRIRRMRMYVRWAQYPEDHDQVLAVVVGPMSFEYAPPVHKHKITTFAHPWLKQLDQDFRDTATVCENLQPLLTDIQFEYTRCMTRIQLTRTMFSSFSRSICH